MSSQIHQVLHISEMVRPFTREKVALFRSKDIAIDTHEEGLGSISHETHPLIVKRDANPECTCWAQLLQADTPRGGFNPQPIRYQQGEKNLPP